MSDLKKNMKKASSRQIKVVDQEPEVDSKISSSDRVVEAIANGIHSSRYVPGQKLIEADLTHTLGVSRGPVREAFKRLHAEGVVTLTRHRGAYIRALNREEADELMVVLEGLTGLMARLAAEAVNKNDNAERLRHAHEWLDAFKGDGGRDIAFMDKRRQFYDTLLKIGGNEQLARILPTMLIHLLRMQIQPFFTENDRHKQLDEYAAITEAVLSGDPQLSERSMRRHFRRTRTTMSNMPDEAFKTPKS
jgi:DNA-binding GntR family transcriptional regulator